jgi:hypothetical protein
MKVSPRILALAWAAVDVFASACGRVPLQATDGGGGADACDCAGLDQRTCSATVGCTAHMCPRCYGQTIYAGCYRFDDAPPVCVGLPCYAHP